MTTLGSGFEADLRTAALEAVAASDAGRVVKDAIEAQFRRYASRNGYDIEHIWQDADGPFVDRDGDRVRIRIEFPELTALFEYGVSPHTIEGNPLLSFIWNSPPGGTRPPDAPRNVTTQSVNWGSVTGGIPEARAIRDGLNEAIEHAS